MNSKIYTSCERIEPHVGIKELKEIQINDHNDIKKYLSYVYQEYGDFYELNTQSEEKSQQIAGTPESSVISGVNFIQHTEDTEHTEIAEEITILTRVNNFFALQQSQNCCSCSCFWIYFIYLAVSVSISCGLSYIAAFLLFKVKFKILLAVTICIFIQVVFLAGIPLLKKINSTYSQTNNQFEV